MKAAEPICAAMAPPEWPRYQLRTWLVVAYDPARPGRIATPDGAVLRTPEGRPRTLPNGAPTHTMREWRAFADLLVALVQAAPAHAPAWIEANIAPLERQSSPQAERVRQAARGAAA